MPEQPRTEVDDKLQAWIKPQVDAAVRQLMARGVVAGVVVEAKPAWVLPFTLLIGRIRELGQSGGFDWFICGDAPLTCAASSVAASPREAARHFALQWQIDAARQGGAGNELAQRAEALYELVENDSLWQEK